MFLNAILVPFNSMQAPFVSEVLKGGAEVLSVMGVVLSLSSLLASVSYPKMRKKLSARVIMVLCALGIGLFYLGLILGEPIYGTRYGAYAVVAFLSFVLGLVIGWTNAFASVEFMKIIAPDYMARSGALFTSLTMAVSPIASLLISLIAKVLSVRIIFFCCGVVSLFVMIVMTKSRTLKEMK